ATGRTGKLVAELFSFYQRFHSEQYGWDGSPVHDAVAVAHVIRDDLVQTVDRGVVVDTGGELSRGRTYVDLWGRAGWEPNAHVAVDIDAQGFVDFLVERLASLGRCAFPPPHAAARALVGAGRGLASTPFRSEDAWDDFVGRWEDAGFEELILYYPWNWRMPEGSVEPVLPERMPSNRLRR